MARPPRVSAAARGELVPRARSPFRVASQPRLRRARGPSLFCGASPLRFAALRGVLPPAASRPLALRDDTLRTRYELGARSARQAGAVMVTSRALKGAPGR